MNRAVLISAIAAASLAPITPSLLGAASTPSGTVLALPASSFGAAQLEVHAAHVLKNDDERISNPQFFPRGFHSTQYTTWHRLTGYFQTARLSIPNSGQRLTFDYAASIFLRSRGASRAWKDGSGFYPSNHPNASASACQAGKGVSCTGIIYRSKAGFTAQIVSLQEQRCLFEMRGVSPTRLYTREKALIAQTLLLVQSAAIHAGKQQACAQAPPAPSFSFDSLAILNSKGQAQSTFGPKDTVLIRLTYTGKNLPKHINGTIKRTFEYYDKKSGKWTQVGHPVTETSNTITNGTHFIEYTYIPLPLGAAQRIIVDLTAASHSQERTAYIHITGR